MRPRVVVVVASKLSDKRGELGQAALCLVAREQYANGRYYTWCFDLTSLQFCGAYQVQC